MQDGHNFVQNLRVAVHVFPCLGIGFTWSDGWKWGRELELGWSIKWELELGLGLGLGLLVRIDDKFFGTSGAGEALEGRFGDRGGKG